MKVNISALKDSMKKTQERDASLDGGGQTDERYWRAETPKKGKSVYRIRVVPVLKPGADQWVKYFQHRIKGTTGWVVENCPETFPENNGKCPICNHSRKLFATGDTKDEEMGKKFWRGKNWITNIKVIKDGREEGANEGKVFIYRFGKKIYDKFNSALNPEDGSGEEQLFFIDPNDGYDFMLKCKTVSDFANYDESEFAREATALAKSDKKMEELLDEVFDLEAEALAPKKFKSIEILENILNTKILGVSAKSEPTKPKESIPEPEEEDDIPSFDDAEETKAEEPKDDETAAEEESLDSSEPAEDDDDAAFLAQLASEMEKDE